jgi:hypothetical protein
VAVVLLAWMLRVWRLPDLPPGLHHDEAIEGLNALEILGGQLRFWFPAGGGREPLFMYLAAGAIGVLGPTAFALRLLAAACMTLAVPAAFALGRRLVGDRVALIGAILMATSYWQVHTSRMGLRSALLPALAAIAFALLFRGLDRGRPVLAGAGGVALGLSVYVYFAARLLPLVALPVLLLELLWPPRLDDKALASGAPRQGEDVSGARAVRANGREGTSPSPTGGAWCAAPVTGASGERSARRRLAVAAAFAVAALAVALPMIAYTLLNPARANERVAEASVFAQPSPRAALRESVLGVLGMFFLRGDEMWKYNLDARPLFSPPLALLFILGLLLCLIRFRERGGRTLLLWLPAMCLPSALATESPHFIRIEGLAPVLFLLPALPLGVLWTRLPRLAPLGLALLVTATTITTWRDYFVTWAESDQTGPAFAYDMAEAAAALRELRPSDPVYLSVDPYEPRQLVVQFLASPVLPVGSLRWFDGRRGLVVPPGPAVELFPSSARPPEGWLGRVGGVQPMLARPLVDAYRLQPPGLGAAPLAVFDRQIELLRAEPPATTPADEPATVLLALRLREALRDDLTLFVHVEGTSGGWGGRDDRFYLTSNREAGETIVAAFATPLEPGTPPGDYRLSVGIYRRDGARLRLADGRDELPIGTLRVLAAERPWRGPEPPGANLARPVGPSSPAAGTAGGAPGTSATPPGPSVAGGAPVTSGGLRLRGATIAPRELAPGDRLTLSSFWSHDGSPPAACELSVRAVQDGKPVGQAAAPLSPGHPPTTWVAGDLVQERTSLTIGPEAASGAARVELTACGTPVDLGEVRIAGVHRERQRPSPPTAKEARFGDKVRLIGYGVEGDLRPAGEVVLSLYWAADGPTGRPLTVFTHVLDAQEKVRGQHDGVPVDGSRPTSGWDAGEYLVDRHRLKLDPDLPPGDYALEIGLYDAASGARAPVADPSGQPLGDRLILEKRAVR